MFRKLSDDYRSQEKQQNEDAEELESGRWRLGNQYGDQSGIVAAMKRALADRLSALSRAYERLGR